MIKIDFELKSKEEVLIFGTDIKGVRTEIGRIMTPAGSGGGNINAIQICGWDEAYDIWGCGVYGDEATNKMKKDIQLIWFNNYKKMDDNTRRTVVIKGNVDYLKEDLAKAIGVDKLKEGNIEFKKDRFDIGSDSICHKCYNYPCECEVKIKYENPFTVKTEQDVKPTSKKEYNDAVKLTILNSLEEKKKG